MFSVLSVVALRRVYPRGSAGKRSVLLALALLAAGCGGGGDATTTAAFAGHLVNGPGFTFRAPEGWPVKVGATSARAGQGTDELVSVTVLPLLKPYRPALFPRVLAELDRVAGTLATGLGGQLTSSRTVTVAGAQSREYEIEHGSLVDRITFVLRGKREFQLTCRWRKSAGVPDACAQLVATFSFG